MTWVRGDLVDVARAQGCAVTAFTSNAVLRASGALTMGAGAALRVRDAYPGIDARLGAAILRGHGGDYLCASARAPEGTWVVAVQTKRDWRDDGHLELTRESLARFAEMMRARPERRAVLNCPLVGLGGFARRQAEIEALVEESLAGVDVRVCLL